MGSGTTTGRRAVLRAGAAWAAASAASAALVVRPAAATPESFSAAMKAFTRGAVPQPGRVQLEISPLVENGNVVPVTLRLDPPPAGGLQGVSLAMFTERNPQPEVLVFNFGPRAARAQVSARIRLAASQRVTAVARLADGSCHMHAVDVLVTLAACIEGDSGVN